ncbi:MAG: thiamine phosphate synthase [Epsilonproteobacteria bacterium]|nr:thiamine phosphate synthase [Campylobacterota bacterium]
MKSYLITDPKYYSNDIQTFENTITRILKNKAPNIVCFRDKESKNIEALIKIFVHVCRNEKIETIFINSYIDLAIKYKVKGVHLTSTQFDKIQFAKNSGLKVVISCHNEEDIKKAIENKADFITYSPIFTTPNKGEPKGLEELKKIVKRYPIAIIALGGIISNEQIKELEKTGVYGFASIRHFV